MRIFKNSTDDETKTFWCDGVLFETLLDDCACFTVFAGNDGQTDFKLFLQLGEKALKLCSKGIDIQWG